MTSSPTDQTADQTTGRCPRSYPFHRPSVTEIPRDYAELRAEGPVAPITMPSGDRGYIVTRYDDVRGVLADQRFSRAATARPGAPRLTEALPESGGLFTMDPPEHTRLRKLVTREFTARRIADLQPRIQQITDSLLDRIEALPRPVDLHAELAFPLPVTVICELLGVPAEDREKFKHWTKAMVSLTAHSRLEVLAERQALGLYFANLIEQKRNQDGTDLLSALTRAHDEDGQLSLLELVIMGITLLVAGTETTTCVIGTGTVTLLQRPELLRKLGENPDLIDDVTEEILRLNPIGDGGPLRVTLADAEIGGVSIPKGSAVMAAIPSANQDPNRFANPTEFSLDREHNAHLAFGHGIHHCLGAALARAELRIVLSTLFRRFPTLRLAKPVEELRMTSGQLVHTLSDLPVTW